MTPKLRKIGRFAVFLVALLLASLVRPDTALAGDITLTKDAESYTIRDQADFFPDRSGKFSIQDVSKPDFASRFVMRPPGASPFGLDDKATWIRFTLDNKAVGKTKWMLVIEAPTLDSAQVFIPDGTGGFQERSAGDTVAGSKRDLRHHNLVFTLNIPEGESRTLYLRVTGLWPDRLPMSIVTPLKLESWDRTTAILFGVIYAIMLMLALHNLFLCVSEGDPSQLLFAAFMVALVLAQGFVNGFVFELLWPEVPVAVDIGATIAMNLATITGLLFTRSLLSTREVSPVAHRILTYLLVLAAVIGAASIADNSTAERLTYALAILAVIAALGTGIRAWQKGLSQARLFVLAWLTLIAGGVVFALASWGFLPEPVSSVLTLQFAGVGTVILLSMSVAERVKVRRENRIADLLESEERYALAIYGGGVEVWDWDVDDNTVRVSETLATSLGLTKPGQTPMITPKQYISAIDVGDRRRYLRAMKAHYDGVTDTFDCQYRLVDRNGEARWINDRAFAWRDKTGRAYRVTGSIRDITAIKQEETGLRRSMEEAQFASRMKSEFLAKMSHELRTPLNAIIGFSQMMVAESLGPMGNEKYRDYAKDIGASGSHLLDLINDILDLSKVEAGKLELNERLVDIKEVVLSSMQFVQGRAKSARVGLSTVFGEPMHQIYADQRALKQIIINLLTNAIKFTPAGGRVTIKAVMDHNNALILTVTDTGVGIAASEVARMLQPFSRVEGRLQSDQEGTGLGLWLTNALVELHGATMDLKSEDGAGTMVVIRFPQSRTITDGEQEVRRRLAAQPGDLVAEAEQQIKKASRRKSGSSRGRRSQSRAGGTELKGGKPANVTEIAHRIRAMWMRLGAKSAIELGLTVEEADAVSKAITGVSGTGLFGTIDQLGLDQMPQVAQVLPVSQVRETDSAVDRMPELIQKMIADGYTGHKGRGGFYRVSELGGTWVKEAIDLKAGVYRPLMPVRLESLSAGNHDLRALVSHSDRGGRFAWLVVSHTLSYAAALVPDKGPDVFGVDEVVKLEDGWRWGPFELIDKLGAAWFARRLQKERRPVPQLLNTVGDGAFYNIEIEVEGPEGQDGAYDTVSPHIFRGTS